MRTDGSRQEQSKDEDGPRGQRPGSAYEKYKQQLHAFFNGQTPLPDHLKDLLATRPGAAEHMDGVPEQAPAPLPVVDDKKKTKKKVADSERSARRVVNGPGAEVAEIVELIKKATSPREAESAIDQLRAKGHGLPQDPEVLSKALSHGKEEVHAEALRGIKAALETGLMKPSTLLKTRIHNVALLAASAEVRELCSDLKRTLG